MVARGDGGVTAIEIEALVRDLRRDGEGTVVGTVPSPRTDRVVSGVDFLADDPLGDLATRWGSADGVVAWAVGEPLLVVGPTGVGKTTLAAQLVGGLLGLRGEVLGLPVLPVERVGYLALDRPKQIRRAMRRLFDLDRDQDALKRLEVWAGPLPADVGKSPELLVDLARAHHWEAVVVDSLKDLTARVADDEAGSNVNRALQHLVADGIDVLALHHQRKGQDGRRPKTLEDVYGSTWLTAGAGSVILLWGEAGSELVELEHLKQPADPIGPWRLEHDHHTGTTTILAGFDALAFLRHRPGGATLAEIAQAQWAGTPTEAQRKRTERNLRRLARHDPPLVHTTGRTRAEGGGFESARYCAAATDTPTDTPPAKPATDAPRTPTDGPA